MHQSQILKNISFLLLLMLTMFISCTPSKKLAVDNKVLDFVELFSSNMNDKVACYRVPAMITALNGDLIVAIDERVPSCGDLKWNNDINIVMRKSTDHGKTWSAIKHIIDYPIGESASDPSMILDRTTGQIFLFFNYMNQNSEQGVYYLKMISSKDNGASWSPPTDITDQITKPEWKNDFKFITSGRGIQTSSGTLMHTLVNLQNGLHLFKSDNHGKSWSLIDTAIQPADESKVIELADSTLMINSRVSKIGSRYIHRSINNGKDWVSKIDTQLTDPACNASLIRYSLKRTGSDKNRLLFSNLNSKNKRENLTVRISYDEGQTWSEGRTIYSGSSAYSSMTVLENGDIGLIFEQDDYTKNVFVRFSLAWLTR